MEASTSFNKGELIFSVDGQSHTVNITDGLLTRIQPKELPILEENVVNIPYREKIWLKGNFLPQSELMLLQDHHTEEATLTFSSNQKGKKIKLKNIVFSDTNILLITEDKE